ncbi:MAG: hypothetical protein EZS26_002509 [Candidatus Ordinivivax streblomastigis]|uniref:Uncharacterized protein n=1 Tax=Candidatus Ordinivivax streblomastigis TaxID=2540710 RepID=A0A5M8NWS7_9BACT|nr:MAG: hypothetical protein EZS26_002509 [Candidatus Ordinivivax streblomastigis]
MNHQEFIERTGLTPTIEEYKTIEAIYMAAGEMDKDEFCKEFKKCGNSRLVAELFKMVCTLKGQYEERCNEIEDLHEQKNAMVDFLIDRAQAFSDKELLEKASEMAGQKEVIRRRIVKGYNLWSYETEWMLNNIF